MNKETANVESIHDVSSAILTFSMNFYFAGVLSRGSLCLPFGSLFDFACISLESTNIADFKATSFCEISKGVLT